MKYASGENEANLEMTICENEFLELQKKLMSFSDHSGMKLLVVDDNDINVRVICDCLMIFQVQTICCYSGKEALALSVKEHPDLIVLDVMMPEMDGFEICRLLKEDPKTKEIPIIFMTARTGIEDQIRGYKLGAVDYITKPIQFEDLRARIDTHLTKQRLEKGLKEEIIWRKNTEQQLRKEITARKEVEEELRKLNANKDKFFSIIAHDLRNHVLTVLNTAEVLGANMESIDASEIETLVDIQLQSSQNLHALLENLLEWAGFQQGKIKHYPVYAPIAGLVKETCHLSASHAVDKNLTLTHDIQPDLVAYCDTNSMKTVLRNLISNAIKFSGQNATTGKIEVTAVQVDNHLEISISDTGVGMDESTLSTLFCDREIVTTRGTNGEKGSGLGLSLCRDFVTMNGGEIWAESVVGQGTTFKFTIPCNPPLPLTDVDFNK